jgi:hypothetical protein
MKKLVSRIKERKGNDHYVEVLLYEPATHPDEFNEYYDIDETDLVAIADWVTAHELGKRTSHNHWKLNSKEAVTMFLLRWNQ